MPSMPRAEWIERGKTRKFLRREQTSGCGRNGPIAWNAYEHESAQARRHNQKLRAIDGRRRSDQEKGAHQAPAQIKIAPRRGIRLRQSSSSALYHAAAKASLRASRAVPPSSPNGS